MADSLHTRIHRSLRRLAVLTAAGRDGHTGLEPAVVLNAMGTTAMEIYDDLYAVMTAPDFVLDWCPADEAHGNDVGAARKRRRT